MNITPKAYLFSTRNLLNNQINPSYYRTTESVAFKKFNKENIEIEDCLKIGI